MSDKAFPATASADASRAVVRHAGDAPALRFSELDEETVHALFASTKKRRLWTFIPAACAVLGVLLLKTFLLGPASWIGAVVFQMVVMALVVMWNRALLAEARAIGLSNGDVKRLVKSMQAARGRLPRSDFTRAQRTRRRSLLVGLIVDDARRTRDQELR